MMITIPLAAAINAISALAEIYFYLLHPLPTLSHRVIFFNFFLCVFWNFGFFISYQIDTKAQNITTRLRKYVHIQGAVQV